MTEPTAPAQASTSADRRTGQAYFLFAASLLLVVILGSVVQLGSVGVGLAITELALILLPAILFVRWKGLPVAEALRWRPVSPTIALLSIAVAITSWGVAAGMFVLLQPLLGEPPAVEALEPQTVPDLLWVLLFAALLPGLCEETLFRGAIQGILRRNGQHRGVLITALLFAVYHVSPWTFLPALFLGLVFGMLVARTGSTVSAILAHIANNAMAFSLTYVYHGQPESAAYLLMGGLAAACLVTFPVFWLRTRGTDASPPVLAAVPAGVERPRAWLLGLVGGSVAILIVAAVAAALLLVDLHTMPDDTLGPEVQRGDQLVIFKSGMVELDLEAGDIVSYHREGERVLKRIAHMEEDSVWVGNGNSEERLSRKEITGKVVHVIKPTEPSKPESLQTSGKEDARGRGLASGRTDLAEFRM